jgi:hypothetical protein
MIKKCDDCGIEIKTVAKCWGCEYFQKVINKSPKNLPKADSNAVLGEVRAWVEENKYSHGAFDLEVINVDDLLEYISEHFS